MVWFGPAEFIYIFAENASLTFTATPDPAIGIHIECEARAKFCWCGWKRKNPAIKGNPKMAYHQNHIYRKEHCRKAWWSSNLYTYESIQCIFMTIYDDADDNEILLNIIYTHWHMFKQKTCDITRQSLKGFHISEYSHKHTHEFNIYIQFSDSVLKPSKTLEVK